MKRSIFLLSLGLFAGMIMQAQKKPLDHSVYDGWQSIGERMISNNGQWVVYAVNVQEGDNELVVQSADGANKTVVPRGYNAVITEDSRFVVFRIKPFYKDTRDARIKKKKAEDMPKDSIGIIELGKSDVWKTSRVRSYKTPAKASGWVAYSLEKKIEQTPGRPRSAEGPNPKMISDSLNHIIDSLQNVIATMPKGKKKNRDEEDMNMEDADGDDAAGAAAEAGTDLVLRNLTTGAETKFPAVLEYYFSKDGSSLVIEQSKDPKDSASLAGVSLITLPSGTKKALSRGGNDFRGFTFSEDGKQIAWMAERDAKPKDLQRTYRVWYYKEGMDSASLLIDKNSVGMKLGMTVSENGNLNFSKSGNRLFFGTAPIQAPKDTTLVDFEHPRLDIWHYKDDYLQTVQLYRLQQDLKENFLAVYDAKAGSIKQLASKELPQVIPTLEGDGDVFVGVTDFGKRIESQWQGGTKKDIYVVDPKTGDKKLVIANLDGNVYPSYTGKYIAWYDQVARNYFAWDGTTTRNISSRIKVPLWNEDNEVPDLPGNYGVVKWEENDNAFFVYDRFGIWKLDPVAKENPVMIIDGRKEHVQYRYLNTDPEEKFLKPGQVMLTRAFNMDNKKAALTEIFEKPLGGWTVTGPVIKEDDYAINSVLHAKDANVYLLTRENFTHPGDLYTTSGALHFVEQANDPVPSVQSASASAPQRLSAINPQQQNYNWGTAELVKYKAYNGKDATGVVFKPENFDPKKKYPLICYFYETLSDNINNYLQPAPIRSAINIPFFVSRGYIIFEPDIHYGTGHPGKDAYDYIVSGARALVKKGWVDSTNMAIQGHSWGGYQAAQVVTMTNLFKCAWAGAPVANMTSAYGGIRWESGVNRQFQYEKTQSRIGATLWEKPQLYIENSPLFHLDKVKTPLVIMANDADGAVPWYQGIELFTAMRRLGKKIWMFNYNGQGHGLTQRQDMRDYQIRMQQFFDYMLKGEKPTQWIINGLPAVKKGKEWGLESVE